VGTVKKGRIKRSRLIILTAMITAFWLVLAANLFRLQIYSHEKFSKAADRQYHKRITLPAFRGSVLDRGGRKFIGNEIKYDLAADPHLVINKGRLAKYCARQFKHSENYYRRKLERSSRFEYLARKVSKGDVQSIIDLADPGVIERKNFRREYPYGVYAAQLLGFTDPDDNGLSGLELQFDKELRGRDGEAVLQYDGPRRVFYNADNPIQRPEHGMDIHLTIDKNIQTVAEQQLAKGVRNMNAKSGMAVVMDPFSGRVLAAANYPSFNPNRQQDYPAGVKRNRIVTDLFEPGSTMKIFTAAALLQEKIKKRDDLVFCENGRYKLHKRYFHDTRKYAWLTFKKVIENSSNIGMIKFSKEIKSNQLFRYLKNFGFGSSTEIGLLGEEAGSLKNPKQWDRLSKPSISIGYGISVTAVQLTAAYAAVVNGGYLYRPYVIDHLETPDGEVRQQTRPLVIRQVISKEVCDELKSFMLGAVENGTGKLAKPKDIITGGKTGTARKLKKDRSGYHTDRYISSFAGFAPYDHPQYVCVVIIDEPQKAYYGGTAAAPIFKEIINGIVNLEIKQPERILAKDTNQGKMLEQINDLPSLDGFRTEYAEALLQAREIDYEIEGSGGYIQSHALRDDEVILQTGKMNIYRKKVPKLTGLTLREALAKVDMSMFKITLSGRKSGIVRKQHPQPGKTVKSRTALTLTCR